ncbi:MAG: SWIM zinc finger family protein [Marinilabiliaceae bacterium]
MQIPLNAFEQYIDETILARGLSYFKKGQVQEPVMLSTGEYKFVVKGTEDYTVRISLSNGTITQYLCNCPYDMGPVCKHVAAAVFHLQQDELEISKKTNGGKSKPRKKRKTIADQVNELLDQVPHDELKQFVWEKTEQDRAFRNMFLASFAHLNSNESKTMYAKQVKSVLQAASGRHGFIDWSSAGYVGMAVGQLLNTAQKHIEAKNYQSAFFISIAVMEELTKALQFSDDSGGDIGGSINAGFEILGQLAEISNNESLRKQIIDYCFSAFDKEIYEGWDWHLGVLRIAAQLVKTEEETNRIFEQIERAQGSEYEKKEAQTIRYEVLIRTRGEAEANQYLEQHITNSNLRRKAIQKAIDQEDYEKANKLARDGVAYDMKNKPGLAKEWYDWLLKIAQIQGDREKIIEYARYLLIDNFRNTQDYYQVLKEHVKPEKWKEFIENVIEDISKKNRWLDSHQVAQIYIREQWWDRLMEMVKNDPDLRTIDHYGKCFPKDYSNEIIDLYATGILNYMEESVGRKHYKVACRYLRRMIKMGGRDKANQVISDLRKKYPQRRALLEELNKV